VRLEGLGKLKKSTSSGTRTGDLPACSIVPQPTTLPRAPVLNIDQGWKTFQIKRVKEKLNIYLTCTFYLCHVDFKIIEDE
jgi:hypothetical protein